MFDKNIFGAKVKIERTKKQLTMKELAAQLNISFQQLGHIEIGARSPSVELLVELADFFNVSLDYLVGRSDDPAVRQ